MAEENKNKVDHVISDDDLDSEVVELEFDEDSVAYYIVDEQDNEIGVCLIEDGEEVEYMYEDDAQDEALKEIAEMNLLALEAAKQQASLVVSSVSGVKDEINDFRDEAAQAAKDLKSATKKMQNMIDEVKDSVKIFSKKNKKTKKQKKQNKK